MTDGTVDTSPQLYARMAGISYLLGSLTSVLGQMVILGMLVVSGSATATAAQHSLARAPPSVRVRVFPHDCAVPSRLGGSLLWPL